MHPSEVLQVGDSVNVRVLKIDFERRESHSALKTLMMILGVKAMATFTIEVSTAHKSQSLKGFGAIVELLLV